jgi:hypothetical protein
MCIIPKKFLPMIETPEGIKFYTDDQYSTIFQSLDDYHFNEIRPNDIVLDIGANIGGFTLPAAKRAKHVCAVEPIFADRLQRNLEANCLRAQIITGALGGKSGESMTFSFGGHRRSAITFTLTDLKEISGGCDYLKCDCEGGEWLINIDELEGIRHLEMELHGFGQDHKKKFKRLMRYLNNRYTCDFQAGYFDMYGLLHAELIP